MRTNDWLMARGGQCMREGQSVGKGAAKVHLSFTLYLKQINYSFECLKNVY